MDATQTSDGQTNTDTVTQQADGQATTTDTQQGTTLMTNEQGVDAVQGQQDSGAPAEGSDDKPTDGSEGQPSEPVNYEFTLPEGFEFDESIKEQLTTFAKEKNLSAEEAQKLVDLGVEMRHRDAEKLQAAQQQWVEQIKADPEMGGAQLGENVAVARKAIEAFGTPELKSLLNSTGFGNHPEVVRAFYKVGKAISEDKLVIGDGKPKAAGKDAAKTLFPNQS